MVVVLAILMFAAGAAFWALAARPIVDALDELLNREQ